MYRFRVAVIGLSYIMQKNVIKSAYFRRCYYKTIKDLILNGTNVILTLFIHAAAMSVL